MDAGKPVYPDVRALTSRLLKCFFSVYRELGSGYLETVYANALEIALVDEGIQVRREVSIPVRCRGRIVGSYKADFLIANSIVVELKVARLIDAAHEAQLINNLRASTMELGYHLNLGPRPSFRRFILSNDRKTPLRSPAAICGS